MSEITNGSERRAGVEERVRDLEDTIYGHHNKQSNRYVDGLLQIAQDTRHDVHTLKRGAPWALTAVIFLLAAIASHQYGFLSLLSRW